MFGSCGTAAVSISNVSLAPGEIDPPLDLESWKLKPAGLTLLTAAVQPVMVVGSCELLTMVTVFFCALAPAPQVTSKLIGLGTAVHSGAFTARPLMLIMVAGSAAHSGVALVATVAEPVNAPPVLEPVGGEKLAENGWPPDGIEPLFAGTTAFCVKLNGGGPLVIGVDMMPVNWMVAGALPLLLTPRLIVLVPPIATSPNATDEVPPDGVGDQFCSTAP